MATKNGATAVLRSASTLTNSLPVEENNPVDQLNKVLYTALNHLAPEPPTGKHPKTALCYIVVEHYKKGMMPALVPCLGKLNKEGTTMLGFDRFLSGVHKHYEGWLSEDQKTLNQLCHQICKLAENLTGTLINAQEPIHPVKTTALLTLWRQALCLLQHQPFVFHYVIYETRELRGVPRKKRLTKIQVAAQAPKLGFQLTKKEGVYTLDLLCLLNEKWATAFYADLPFFIRLEEHYYLLSSLQDAAVAQWMDEQGGSVGIAPKDYPHFKTQVLRVLKQHYPVEER